MSKFRAATFLLAAAFASQAAVARDAKPGDSLAAVRAQVHATVAYCAGGLERFLPGQYYFCAAVRDFGNGHDGLARERLRDAAYWASKPAQYLLGLMNYNGEGIPANRPLGTAWLALAAERHDQRFEPAFAKAFLSLSTAERAQANVYWADMRKQYSDARAGTRAQRVYLAEMRNLKAASMFGGSVFINGLTPPGDLGDKYASPADVGESGFSVEKMIDKSAADLFQGMEGHVTVGEAQMSLVPIGSVGPTPASEKSSPAR